MSHTPSWMSSDRTPLRREIAIILADEMALTRKDIRSTTSKR